MSDNELFPVLESLAKAAHVDAAGYAEMYRRSVDDPDGFWGDDRIIFQQEPDEDMRKRILHYLYNEAFIKDRRTICQII